MSAVWPASPRRGGGSGGGVVPPPPPVSALQPLTMRPDNLVAAYAFNETGAACNTDRSGNENNFVWGNLASELANVMDLIPGKAAVLGCASSLYPTAPTYCQQNSQAWALYGAMTIIERRWMAAPPGVGTYRSFSVANAADTGAGSWAWQLACNGNNQFIYYAERNKVGQVFQSTLAIPTNQWSVLSMRRFGSGPLAGQVRLGVASGPGGGVKAYQQSVGLSPPQTATTANMFCRWGYYIPSDVQQCGSAWADWACWNVDLTDAEVEAQAEVMLAGAP